ncbi:hypothetical protein P4359_28225 [Bacillus thuringiensis]|nr:hypothetical protein [Bacillus thuringiensis]
MDKLTEDLLRELYIEKGMSDREIGDLYGVTRANISYHRKKWGIEGKPSLSKKAIQDVQNKLDSLGFVVENMKKKNTHHIFDLLVENTIRLDIRSTETLQEDTFRFKLLDSDNSCLLESDNRLQLKNGRTKKILRNTCDFVILVGYLKGVANFWVIPSRNLKDDLNGISIRPYSDSSKYLDYKDSWGSIRQTIKFQRLNRVG